MKRLTAPLFAGLVALGATSGFAQPYQSWTFAGYGTTTQPIALGTVDLSGNVTTLVASSALAVEVAPKTCEMDADNRTHLLGFTNSKNFQCGFIRVDGTGTILGTIGTSAGSLEGLVLDTNGDYIALTTRGLSSGSTKVLRIDRNTNAMTTLWAPGGFDLARSVTLDKDTGDFWVMHRSGPNYNLYRIAADGSAVTTIASTSDSIRQQIAFEPRTGNTVVGGYPNGAQPILRSVSPSGTITTILATGPLSGESVHPDRASAANDRYIVGSSLRPTGIFTVDANTRAIATLHASQSYRYLQVVPNRGRNIGVVRQTAASWQLNIDFPGEAGMAWAIGLSLTGLRPASPLADGRSIPLAVDALTVATASGELGGVLTKNAGILDATGNDTTLLDVTGLGLTSIPVWAVALTVDPASPIGIRTISDPILIRM